MNKLLNPDNAFFTFMGRLFDLVVLSVLWLLLSIPIVTIIPATSALYYSVVKVVRRDRGYLAKEFWRSFRQNLRQGSLCSIVVIVAIFVMVIDFNYALALMGSGEVLGSAFFGVFLVLSVLIFAILMYLCPILSRFEMKFTGLFKTAFFLSARHIITTVCLLILFVVVLLGCYIILPGMFLFPAFGVLISSYLMEPIFKKYVPSKQSVGQEDDEYRGKDEWYLE